jgi:xylan 1,4-beta-xylosidase
VQDRMDALAYWVISDHFEELGRPPRLFHNGFGLLTVGNLRKPRYWAVHLAAHQGDQVLASELTGDGAEVLVRTWATKHADGTIDVLVWNGTINGAVMGGDPRLDRDVHVSLGELEPEGYQVRLARVDQHHSNIVANCPPDGQWPDAALWQTLHAQDRLHEEPLGAVATGETSARFEIRLPLPGVARIRLTPNAADARKEGSP